MAYSKKHTLTNGSAVTHYRVQSYRVDYQSREASAIVSAYTDAANPEPVRPVFAKLRLNGDTFDSVLGKKELAKKARDINAALYTALQAKNIVDSTTCIICDAGSAFFRDAESV